MGLHVGCLHDLVIPSKTGFRHRWRFWERIPQALSQPGVLAMKDSGQSEGGEEKTKKGMNKPMDKTRKKGCILHKGQSWLQLTET